MLKALGGDKDKLVIDLSCRRNGNTWFVAMNKWQTITNMEVTERECLQRRENNFQLIAIPETIKSLESYCSEFLIHAADNEGLQKGIDEQLVRKLGEWCSIPVTYAGGGRHLEDLELVKKLSKGKVDLTIGSALNVFGGNGVTFEDCVKWNQSQEQR